MGAYRHQATWRSTTFNEGYADAGATADDPANIVDAKLNDQVTIDELNIQRVSVQDYRELRQYLEGAEPNEAYEGVRAITGSGVIAASNRATLEDKAWALNEQFSVAACRIAFFGNDPKGVGPFDFKRDTGPTEGTTKALRFYCRPGPGRPVWIGRRGGGFTLPWSFQLIAFDPMAYDQTQTQTTLGNLAGGNNTVTNPGNIYTKPQIVITQGAGNNGTLTLTNTTTGQVLVLDLSTVQTETIVIDVARATIARQSDGANRYSIRTSGFVSQLYLVAGANTITASRSGGGVLTSIVFAFRGAYA